MAGTYAFKGYDEERMARVLGRNLSISTKQSIEICNFIRKKNLQFAKARMQDVLNMKAAIPFKRFNDGVGHRPGKIAAGRYPQNACKAFLKMLESVETNAQQKGLNTSDLIIIHTCAQKGSSNPHYGRNRGRMMKNSHVEIIVEERSEKKKPKAVKKEVKEDKKEKKVEEKKEVKPEVKKEESKKEVKKEEPKTEAKPEVPKAEKPVEQKTEQKPAESKPVESKPTEKVEEKPKPVEKAEPKKEEPKQEANK